MSTAEGWLLLNCLMDIGDTLKFQETFEMLLLEDPNIRVVAEFCLRELVS